MTPHHYARDLALDGAKATPIVGYVAGVLAGVDWTTLGAALMALYTALLVLEKLWKFGVFAAIGKAFAWAGVQLARLKPKPRP